MWKLGTFIFVCAVILAPILIEIARAVVHRRRERRDGLGGTQDIAAYGVLGSLACLVGLAICGVGWLLTR